MNNLSVRKLVFMALFATATMVATYFLKMPFANGYFNLGEIMIYTSALLLGPVVGGIAGALGAAIADIYAGFLLPWAPITFILKGLEGYIVGKLSENKTLTSKITAVAIGGLTIIIGYPLATGLIYGWPASIPELYMDIVQVIVGGMVAIPLSIQLESIFKEEGGL